MVLACEDALLDVVTVVDDSDADNQDPVGNSFLQIWKLRFGHKVIFLFSSTVWSRV